MLDRLTVMLATSMEVLDTSIANVSLPHIAGSLSAGIDESTWVLTSYLVSNAIVPPSDWLAFAHFLKEALLHRLRAHLRGRSFYAVVLADLALLSFLRK